MPRLTKKQILIKANRRFQGKWMAAEDLSYIFPVNEILFTGNLPDDPSDQERLPLAIHTDTFIDAIDDFVKVDRIIETSQNTTFHNNPYYVESHPDASGIMFISKAKARKFIRNIREKLLEQAKLLAKVSP